MKQLLPVIIVILGITVSVLLIQNSTTLKSKAYDLLDFIPAFHASENDPNYQGNLDVYKDGIINSLDIIKDRAMQLASRSATATQSAEASASAEVTPPIVISPSPSPSPTPTPTTNAADEYQKILNKSK